MSSPMGIGTATNNTKIYDYFYKKFADQIGYKITVSTKARIVDKILDNMSWDCQQAIRALVKYGNCNYDTMVKITGIPKKKLIKNIETATRYMYSPNNIRSAVPKYYTIKKKNQTKLTEKDFNKYILNRLKESGFEAREQLKKHLSNGWYYLWTIPGCGDASRQKILIAIDKWNEEEIIHNVDEYRERKRNKK